MAFQNKNLSVIAYANGFTLWYYQSPEETLQEIEQPDYFSTIHSLLAVGDIFIINAKKETAMRKLSVLEDKHVCIAPLDK